MVIDEKLARLRAHRNNNPPLPPAACHPSQLGHVRRHSCSAFG